MAKRFKPESSWFNKSSLLAALASAAIVPAASTQPAVNPYVPTLTFDVVSVRQSPEADSYMVTGSFAPHSSSLVVKNFDVMNLLSIAYDVRRDQIAGAPNWTSMFNIQAKADSSVDERLTQLGKEQVALEQHHMLQELLADRFKLKTHWETREGLAYNLVVAKNGPKLDEAKDSPPTAEEQKTWGGRPLPTLYQKGDSRSGFDFIAHGCSSLEIAQMLAGQFGHPVMDKTGLAGRYDFILHYHGSRLTDREAGDLDPVPPLDTAIQEQLGLKLESTKAPSRVLVVDHIEKPSEN